MNLGLLRFLPILLALGLALAAVGFWPGEEGGRQQWVAWLNVLLLLAISGGVIVYGLRLLAEKRERRPGSHLRFKLVLALVGMLLVPSVVIQVAANQIVGRGLDVWFDVRVDTLLDRALSLAQDFYSRVKADMNKSMPQYIRDSDLQQGMVAGVDYGALTDRLAKVREHEGWNRLQLFDKHGRLLADAQEVALGALEAPPLGSNAKLAMTIGNVVTEISGTDAGETVVAYAPLFGEGKTVIGLLRAEVELPPSVVKSARAVEADYRDYRELERNRQSIQSLFTHTMLITTLLVVVIAGIVALIFARRLTSPIGELAQALHRVTEGDLDVSIPVDRQDELGSLVISFNRMTMRLKQNVDALQKAQNDLTEALGSSRQRQHILESLLANLQTGVLLVDPGGHIRLLNQSLKSFLELPASWMPGRDLLKGCRGRLKPVGSFYDELTHQEQGSLQRELNISVGQKNLHVLARGVRLRELGVGGMSGYLIVLDDVSSLAEAQRSRAWAEVAQRLAHEIKNPLTPIKLAAERLQRRFRDSVADVQVFDSCTYAVISQVERLQRLISDFSMLAKLSKPRLKYVDIRYVLTEMGELYGSYKRIKVELPDEDMMCPCDPDQLRQVLINLLENALAATQENDGAVSLSVSGDGDFVDLHVQDYGDGIVESGIEHLFEPYFSTKSDGSGLGLAISRRIADEHEGSLELVSVANPTHFRLRLPVRVSSMEAA